MKAYHLSLAAADAHQRKHGFAPILLPASRRNTTDKPKRGMNQTEKEFSKYLDALIVRGEIDGWLFEPIALKLADGCWYRPDFMSWVEIPNGYRMTIYEVKGGYIWDDSKVKFKVAKEHTKWAEFQMWQKSSGRWARIA